MGGDSKEIKDTGRLREPREEERELFLEAREKIGSVKIYSELLR